MIDWLRVPLMIFYAPLRGMREVRDRGSLAPIALIAVLSQFAFDFVTRRFGAAPPGPRGHGFLSVLTEPAMPVMLIAIVLVPILTLVANTLERRGSFRVVITQEYAPVAASLFYVLTAANIFGILMAVVFHYTGVQTDYIASAIQNADKVRAWFPAGPEFDGAGELLKNPATISHQLFAGPRFCVFAVGTIIAVKDAFRMSMPRAMVVTFITWFVSVFTFQIVERILSSVLGSPFLLFFLFMLLRGYFSDIMGSHRAKAAFKQNLESATLNPADASAHYNLAISYIALRNKNAALDQYRILQRIDPARATKLFNQLK